MKDTSFKERANKFMRSVINQRKFVMKKGASHINAQWAEKTMNSIEIMLPINSTPALAKFLIRHSDNLSTLACGGAKQHERLTQLVNEAKSIIKQPVR